MKIEKLAEIIEKMSPLEIQEPWDNSGFQVKLSDSEIYKVLVALEISTEVIHEAINFNADIIVTHHPMFFNPIKHVCDNNVTGNYLIELIKHDINVYSSHTPFDKCRGGNNDYLAKLLHLCDVHTMESDEGGFCRVGLVDGECSAGEYIEQIADWLKIDKRLMSFAGNMNSKIQKVGLCTGAGDEFAELAAIEGCDLFVTGDVKHHRAQTARELGLNILDIGHYGSEKIFIKNMSDYLRANTYLEIAEQTADANPFVAI